MLWGRLFGAACLFAAACCAGARASDPSPAPGGANVHSSAGVQGLLMAGVHTDAAGTQHGAGGGPLIEFTIRVSPRFLFHAEGIPVVSAPQRTSAFYGNATPALGIFNGSLRFAIDHRARYWLGVGTTIINQRTPLPNLNQVVSSRLAGARYEVAAHVPLQNGRFYEVIGGVAPRLFGADRYIYSDGSPSVDKDEKAVEEDLSVAYGIEHRHSAILFGLRTLNFAAQFTQTGSGADRNNGAGVMIELRHYIGN